MGALPTQLAEYDTRDAEGREVDLSERKTTFIAQGDTGTNVPVIDSREAAAYQLDSVLRGSDGWNADSVAFILPAPLIACKGSRVLWHDPTGQAACFLVSADGKAWLTKATSTTRKAGQTVSVRMVSSSFVAGDEAVCNGKTTFIAQGDTGTNVPVIDSTEASKYTIDNVLRGSDGWNADSVAFILPAPLMACKGSRVLWHDPTGLAACFLVSVGGKAWLTSATATRRKPGQTVSVRLVSKSFVAGDAAVCKGKDAGHAHAHVSRKVLSRTFADADGKPVDDLKHGLNTITEWLAGGIMRTHTVHVR